MSKIYVDTKALGSGRVIVRAGGFFAREFPIPEEVAEGIEKLHQDWALVQSWLHYQYNECARRDHVVEVPDQIKEVVCPEVPSAEPPKKKATAAPSRKKSPTRRKKKASTSTTSPKKAK